MQCSSCHHENREGAKFCEECGTRLRLLCSNCGHGLRPGAKFCDECGTPIASPEGSQPTPPRLEDMQEKLYIPAPLAERMQTAAEAMQGENRLVTALFADISGFTDLSNQHAPEAIVNIVNDCFKAQVPDTIQSVILSRVDRLESESVFEN